MKEKHIIDSIRKGGSGGGIIENGQVIVELESHIEGRQADLTRRLLEMNEDSPEYAELSEKLRAIEERNGFAYDLSLSHTHRSHLRSQADRDDTARSPILSCPKAGWSQLTIGSFHTSVSYVTDVPTDCLRAAIRALREKTCFFVEFDTEGKGEVKLIANRHGTIIVHDTDSGPKTTERGISKTELIRHICRDIRAHLDEWAHWSPLSEETDDKGRSIWESDKVRIEGLLAEAERLLKASN